METFWFVRLRFRRAYDYASDSDFRFSPRHKRSYNPNYDSLASENKPLKAITQGKVFDYNLTGRMIEKQLFLN